MRSDDLRLQQRGLNRCDLLELHQRLVAAVIRYQCPHHCRMRARRQRIELESEVGFGERIGGRPAWL